MAARPSRQAIGGPRGSTARSGFDSAADRAAGLLAPAGLGCGRDRAASSAPPRGVLGRAYADLSLRPMPGRCTCLRAPGTPQPSLGRVALGTLEIRTAAASRDGSRATSAPRFDPPAPRPRVGGSRPRPPRVHPGHLAGPHPPRRRTDGVLRAPEADAQAQRGIGAVRSAGGRSAARSLARPSRRGSSPPGHRHLPPLAVHPLRPRGRVPRSCPEGRPAAAADELRRSRLRARCWSASA